MLASLTQCHPYWLHYIRQINKTWSCPGPLCMLLLLQEILFPSDTSEICSFLSFRSLYKQYLFSEVFPEQLIQNCKLFFLISLHPFHSFPFSHLSLCKIPLFPVYHMSPPTITLAYSELGLVFTLLIAISPVSITCQSHNMY